MIASIHPRGLTNIKRAIKELDNYDKIHVADNIEVAYQIAKNNTYMPAISRIIFDSEETLVCFDDNTIVEIKRQVKTKEDKIAILKEAIIKRLMNIPDRFGEISTDISENILITIIDGTNIDFNN